MSKDVIKEVKVSVKTDPKQLATSILYALKEDKVVKAIALGQAIIVLTKSLAILNLIKDKQMKFDFQPEMQYITGTGDLNIHNAVVFTISKI